MSARGILVYVVGVPYLISKLAGLEDGEEVVVTTENGYQIEGTVECPDVVLNASDPKSRSVHVLVLISEEQADELGSVWCDVRVGASRTRSGWKDLEASYVDEVDENLCPEKYESLGEVEGVERID